MENSVGGDIIHPQWESNLDLLVLKFCARAKTV